MKNITNNLTFKTTMKVTEDMLASHVGSGTADVFATPMMIAMMENTAMHCIARFLDDNETSVGTEMNCQHISASPLGIEVSCVATVVSVDGRKIDFEIEASDSKGKIGSAKHSRFVVDKTKFMTKAQSKLDV